MKEHYNEVIAKQGKAAGLTSSTQFAEAERVLKEALATAEREIEQQRDSELLMPADFDPQTRRTQIQRQLREIAARAEKQRKQEREAQALLAICGEKPVIGSWDGGIYQIESALKKVAHDPSSIDVENCTEPLLYRDSCWVTTCNVRGKNAFGALVLDRKRFSISNLGVEELK
ncbi:MAG TPA: hypothetical protein VKB93_26135 [Thermoanaerobaculia bacterium]|nr:hypothetical protein [Thermoanaerobaculia bacterium]